MELILWKVNLPVWFILDIINYNVIVRNLTEWTAGNPSLCIDQGTITDGIGNNTFGADYNGDYGPLNTRANLIQGCAYGQDPSAGTVDAVVGRGIVGIFNVAPPGVLATPTVPSSDGATPTPVVTDVPTITLTRRYQVQLALGLMTQEKLIPTKYMASQLAIELTLETVQNCVIADYTRTATSATPGYIGSALDSALNYCVSNVNLIPEILEFDASYDTAFLQGLQNGGV